MVLILHTIIIIIIICYSFKAVLQEVGERFYVRNIFAREMYNIK
jgi:hypothetical protein